MTLKFTDSLLAQLYFSFLSDYKSNTQPTPDGKYLAMLTSLHYSLEGQDPSGNFISNLSQLSRADKNRAYRLLDTIFTAKLTSFDPTPVRNFYVREHTRPPTYVHSQDVHHHYYQTTNSTSLWDWVILSELMNHRGTHSSGGASSSGSNEDKNKEKSMLELIVIAVVVLAAIFIIATAVISLYYLLCQTYYDLERMYHYEGWMQALLSQLSIIGSFIVSGTISFLFATAPIMALVMGIGVTNPVFVTLFLLGCVTATGAGILTLLFSCGQNMLISWYNSDALIRKDPHRFTLSPREAEVLSDRGLDPDKVKCAILELREQMGKKPITPFFSSRAKEVQDSLDTIRELRSGEFKGHSLKVGDMTFDLRKTVIGQVNPADEQPPPYSSVNPGAYSFHFGNDTSNSTVPSAPSLFV